ncbi:uncharacterized protein LOC118755120 [Rhagoletis pomonella]|uniref:uncharacterized protein LOC118755120 n=1 Tax=Rhagoletis pomonella TaxID=28610 RepID=UPI00177F75E2|nr:uncharacterized protein LOC118755120 [Rhagoletis pomonella]XP_036345859.1 uncharacterized protein LOC118755120 [Rhagoletis pomonella]
MPRFTATRTKTEKRVDHFKIPCRLCGNNHGVRLCPIYRGKSAEERLRAILIHRYCPNCLSPFHRIEICGSNDRCHRCGEKHHTSLHIEDYGDPRETTENHPDNDDGSDGAISLYGSDQTTSWAKQVEAEEVERREEIIPSPPDGGLKTRKIRPPLQHELEADSPIPAVLTHTQPTGGQRNDAETSPFRSYRRGTNSGHRDDAETRPFRSFWRKRNCSQRDGAETRPFRSSRWQAIRAARHRRGDRSSLTIQRIPSGGFRTGKLKTIAVPAPIMRSFVAIAPTAIVRIESGGRLHLVRALIDSCAPSSTIDRDLARELQLEVSNARAKTCSLVLRGKYGVAERVITQARLVTRYNRLSPAANIDPTIATPFQFMRLADPQFYRATPTRLTLGADVYAQVMVCGTPPTTIGGLLAQASMFGLIISGAHQM